MHDSKDNLVQAILDKTDIVELINEVVPLQKRGKNHFGLCPFHHEKTPSFSVNADKKLYHCFSCKASGNAITFVKDTKNFTSAEAIKYLAERADITIDSKRYERPNQKYFDINQEALNFYQVMLSHTKSGEAAREYLKQRDLSETLIQTFELGLAPKQKDGLVQALKKKEILESDMIDLGLIHKEETVYDVFRNRIMFPIHDDQGGVVGFSGRTFEAQDDKLAKYMNTTNTVLFDKSAILYNLHRAKPAIKASNRVILFEGFMDVIAAHAAGIKESIAIMGTALTDKHLQKLKRLTAQIILCLDADAAGQEATKKFIDTLNKAKFSTSVALLEDQLDPDDFIKKHGAKRFKSVLDEAPSSHEYLYGVYKNQVNLKKITDIEWFKKRVFTLIQGLSHLEQDYFMRKMAEDMGMSLDILALDFKEIKKKQLPVYKRIPKVEITDKFKKAERGFIRYFIKDEYYVRRFRREFKDAMFSDKHARDIELEIFEYYDFNTATCIVPELFAERLNDQQKAFFIRYLGGKDHPYDDLEFEDYMRVMREQNRKNAIDLLKLKAKASETLKEKIAYQKEIDALIKEARHGKRKNYSRTD